jgi:hypothetical protein
MSRGDKRRTEIAELVPLHGLHLASKPAQFRRHHTSQQAYDPYHDAARFGPVALNVTKRL